MTVPKIRKEAEPPKTPYKAVIYDIKKMVSFVACYSSSDTPVLVESHYSHHLLNELFEAAKLKATIISLEIDDRPITASALNRLNVFISQPGWTKLTTFRGWRRHLLDTMDNGRLFWNASPSWAQLEQKINLETIDPKWPQTNDAQ